MKVISADTDPKRRRLRSVIKIGSFTGSSVISVSFYSFGTGPWSCAHKYTSWEGEGFLPFPPLGTCRVHQTCSITDEGLLSLFGAVSMADDSSHGAIPSCDHCKQVTFNVSQLSSSYSGKDQAGSERHRELLEEAWGCNHKQKPQSCLCVWRGAVDLQWCVGQQERSGEMQETPLCRAWVSELYQSENNWHQVKKC